VEETIMTAAGKTPAQTSAQAIPVAPLSQPAAARAPQEQPLRPVPVCDRLAMLIWAGAFALLGLIVVGDILLKLLR
jgi:hypothetical protein